MKDMNMDKTNDFTIVYQATMIEKPEYEDSQCVAKTQMHFSKEECIKEAESCLKTATTMGTLYDEETGCVEYIEDILFEKYVIHEVKVYK